MRLVLYTGKGGVGKTTVAAATAVRAAERGLRTLVVSADAAHSLGDVLEQRLGGAPRPVSKSLEAQEIDARVEVGEHWDRIRDFLVSLLLHQGFDAVIAEELALLPGADELTTLLCVERAAASGGYDLIVVDCAPTDAALRVLTLPEVAHQALRTWLRLLRALARTAVPVARQLTSLPLPDASVVGELDELLHVKLAALRERMSSPETSVRLVMTCERMVIDEAARALADLSLFEIACDAVVVNRLLPPEAVEEPFFREAGQRQEQRLVEVGERFAPLRMLRAPLQDDEATGPARLRALGRALFADCEPEQRLGEPAARLRLERAGDGYRATLPLPGASPEELDVAVVGSDLTVTTRARRRALSLPRRVAALPLARARLADGRLVLDFGSTGG